MDRGSGRDWHETGTDDASLVFAEAVSRTPHLISESWSPLICSSFTHVSFSLPTPGAGAVALVV